MRRPPRNQRCHECMCTQFRLPLGRLSSCVTRIRTSSTTRAARSLDATALFGRHPRRWRLDRRCKSPIPFSIIKHTRPHTNDGRCAIFINVHTPLDAPASTKPSLLTFCALQIASETGRDFATCQKRHGPNHPGRPSPCGGNDYWTTTQYSIGLIIHRLVATAAIRVSNPAEAGNHQLIVRQQDGIRTHFSVRPTYTAQARRRPTSTRYWTIPKHNPLLQTSSLSLCTTRACTRASRSSARTCRMGYPPRKPTRVTPAAPRGIALGPSSSCARATPRARPMPGAAAARTTS